MGPGSAMGARLGAQHPLARISLAPLLPENPACVWAPKQVPTAAGSDSVHVSRSPAASHMQDLHLLRHLTQ